MGWLSALECVECKGLIDSLDYYRNEYVCPGCGNIGDCNYRVSGNYVTHVSYLDWRSPRCRWSSKASRMRTIRYVNGNSRIIRLGEA